MPSGRQMRTEIATLRLLNGPRNYRPVWWFVGTLTVIFCVIGYLVGTSDEKASGGGIRHNYGVSCGTVNLPGAGTGHVYLDGDVISCATAVGIAGRYIASEPNSMQTGHSGNIDGWGCVGGLGTTNPNPGGDLGVCLLGNSTFHIRAQ